MRRASLALALSSVVACTGTPASDGGTIFTLGDGGPCSAGTCTVDDLCPCIAPWESHAEYVLCVERARELLAPDGGTTVASAEASSCGRCNGPVALLFMPAGTTTVPRTTTTMAVLGDGRVLVAGGKNGSNDLSSADLYDPILNRFTPTGSMAVTRGNATATTLDTGKVLLVGGASNGIDQTGTAELYDPATGTFAMTGALHHERTIHSATLLNDGRVLIAGGYSTTDGGVSLAANLRDLASAEIYDPTAGTFSDAGSLATPRNRHSATLLADGTVLVAGGHTVPLGDLASAERFDPKVNKFTSTGSLHEGRRRHAAALLADGRVLVAGGTDDVNQIATAEIYDPMTSMFTITGSLTVAREDLAAVTLPDGQALFIGGDNATGELGVADLFDPTAGVFFATGSLAVGREFPVAALLPGGDVLVVGGDNDNGALDDAELYQPVCTAFVPDGGAPILSDMITPPPDLAMMSLPDLAMPDLAIASPDQSVALDLALPPADLSVAAPSDLLPAPWSCSIAATSGNKPGSSSTWPNLLPRDFNKDGRADFVVHSTCSAGAMSVTTYLGKSDGTLGSSASTDLPLCATAGAAGDLTGDGTLDLVIAGGTTIDVMPGVGDGTFNAPVSTTTVSATITGIGVVDLDNDGKQDVVMTTAGGLYVLKGSGGMLQAPALITATQASSVFVVGALYGNKGGWASIYPDATLIDNSCKPAQNNHGTYGDATGVLGSFTTLHCGIIVDLAIGNFGGPASGGIGWIQGPASSSGGNAQWAGYVAGSGFSGPGGGTSVNQPVANDAVGDLNGDGTSDFVAGFTAYLANGGGIVNLGLAFQPAGAADFTGDGKDDLYGFIPQWTVCVSH